MPSPVQLTAEHDGKDLPLAFVLLPVSQEDGPVSASGEIRVDRWKFSFDCCGGFLRIGAIPMRRAIGFTWIPAALAAAIATGVGFLIYDAATIRKPPPVQIETRSASMAASLLLDFTGTVRREGVPTLRIPETVANVVVVFPVPVLNADPATSLEVTLRLTAQGSTSIQLTGVHPESSGRGIVTIDVRDLPSGAYTLDVMERKPNGIVGAPASFPFELARAR